MSNFIWLAGLYLIQPVVLIVLAIFQDQLIKDHVKIFRFDPEKNPTKMDWLVLMVWGFGMAIVSTLFYPELFRAPPAVYPTACEAPEKIDRAFVALFAGWFIFKVILRVLDYYDKRHARVCMVEGMIFIGIYSLLFFLLV
ncbi:MAG: hypothetical protein WCJ59_03505 [bacterium]